MTGAFRLGRTGNGRGIVSATRSRDVAPEAQSDTRRTAVTVHDVARRAGVSPMTVSRVANGTKVREALRIKVQAAIEELNYVPNVAARAARSGSLRIGVLFTNPRSSNLGDFLMGAFEQSGREGCQLVIEPVAAHPNQIDSVRKLVGSRVDAIILPPPLCDSLEALDIVWQAGIPALSFATADPRSHSSAVLIDDFEGARAMTRHLISLGHRDIAFIRGDPKHSPALRREEGFRAAIAEAKLAFEPARILQGMFTYRSGLDVGRQLLDVDPKARPTAIFASNDDMAAAVAAVALGMGIKIPAELSIAGFDDTPITSLMWPQLTTVRQPITDMASKAVEIIAESLRRRRGSTEQSVTHFVAPFELKLRDSTGPAPS